MKRIINTIGHVAVQQAMICKMKLTYKQAAALMGTSSRTIWHYVNTPTGANVRSWEARATREQSVASAIAEHIVNAGGLDEWMKLSPTNRLPFPLPHITTAGIRIELAQEFPTDY